MTAYHDTLTRRKLLQTGACGAGISAGFLTVGIQPALAAKMPQSAVSYQDKPKGGKRCSTCSLFVAPHSCVSVAGTISPNGYCVLWKAR